MYFPTLNFTITARKQLIESTLKVTYKNVNQWGKKILISVRGGDDLRVNLKMYMNSDTNLQVFTSRQKLNSLNVIHRI